MADLAKVLHVSQNTFKDVTGKVLDNVQKGGGESKQMKRIISLFPEWTPEQVFIAGYTIGRLAEMENQRTARHERYIFLNCDPADEADYADKRDK